MDILLCVKRVPTVGGTIVLTDDGQQVDTRMSGFAVSPHEECAVEEAVRIVERLGGSVTGREMAVSGQDKTRAVELAARLLGRDDPESRQALGGLWDVAFDEGRLAALDELQDRFCVCMK